ncbi:podocalyxin-like protein 2 isoform X4 [Orcinus orca]|uniref:podocalyxin-like protein 2 isoform X4 n=1 Tax=Orcinus orca TaxID=9733 RepID=UPI002112AE77|nr:podocalyxin-like protein 2 isoform X4 [Orcinus orca]
MWMNSQMESPGHRSFGPHGERGASPARKFSEPLQFRFLWRLHYGARAGRTISTGTSLVTCAAGSEEPGPEGLTSTSLLDLLLPTGLEPLDSEEPSEAMGLGTGLGAPGSGFASEESEESRILQPPQYFWEEEEVLNDSSLDLGPTADYGFPDLTEKAGPVEDTGQSQEGASLPSPLPKMSLVEPPWRVVPAEEEEAEQLLPVTRSQEEPRSQVHGFPPTGSSQTPGAPEHRHEESGDQASSGVETEAPGGAEASDEDPTHPGASASFSLAPGDTELTPSSAAVGRETLSQLPQEGQTADTPSRTPWDSTQVICKDWSNLAGKNYIILNMAENVDCEVFRRHRGLQLLALVEEALPRHGRSRHGDWHISLSKPSEKERHLLMTLVGEQGVVPTQDVLSMLGDIRRSLVEIGIQNYSTTGSCQARASQVRSDYGTLFVVLVAIGAICVIIIVLGLLYNCWQRRLPKLKHVSHGEELRFVENGCHDNPTLDVASDSQSEMQEKQPSLNGGGAVNGPGGWSALMGGKRDPEDSDVFEEDTHL